MHMQIKQIVALCFLALCTLPVIAHADIDVVNNTETYGTAKMGDKCSAYIGDAGVIKPHSSMVIPQFLLNTLCLFSDCEANIYASNNCDGRVVGTATLNRNKGVTRVQTLDRENYELLGRGNNITINSTHRGRFVDWIKSWF